VASSRRSEPGGAARRGLSRATRRLLPARWQSRRRGVDVSGLAVRPPWWRLFVRRMASGLWPRGWTTSATGDAPASADAPMRARPVGRQPLRARAADVRRSLPLQTSKPLVSKGIVAPGRRSAVSSRLPAAARLRYLKAAVGGTAVPGRVAGPPLLTMSRKAGRIAASPEGPMGTPGTVLSRQSRFEVMRAAESPVPDTPQADEPVREARTAEQRWRAAVAQQPLEAPKPFPIAFRPLVSRLAGSPGRVRYTTGPRRPSVTGCVPRSAAWLRRSRAGRPTCSAGPRTPPEAFRAGRPTRSAAPLTQRETSQARRLLRRRPGAIARATP